MLRVFLAERAMSGTSGDKFGEANSEQD
jgi:hypothetical protein